MTQMQLGTGAEIEVLKAAVTAGVFLGIIYDLFKVVRKTVKRGAAVFVCDLVYALMFGAAFFVFSLAQTDYVRAFIFVGMLAGAVMWSATIGRLAVFLLTSAIGIAIKLADKIFVSPAVALLNKTKSAADGLFVKISLKSVNPKKMPKST